MTTNLTKRVFKSSLPRTLRWLPKASDIEQAFEPAAVLNIALEISFVDHNRDFTTAMGMDPINSAGDRDAGLNLLSMQHFLGGSETVERVQAVRAAVVPVRAYIWAIERTLQIPTQPARATIRQALREELAEIMQAQKFERRWLIRIRAQFSPVQLECLRTTWTSLYQDGTHRRVLRLPDERSACGRCSSRARRGSLQRRFTTVLPARATTSAWRFSGASPGFWSRSRCWLQQQQAAG